ncbi:MAG: B12-binding domain-containing radical SAM protein [Candidatus Lokiarchaeota archaeon]|nr:B12-binding domain-containing radical SAM protein [Candidatus Lokiarchaeota archaeon]
MEEIYYCEPVFRPPSEAYSLLIQVTEGCTYKCDFCVSNLRKKFLIRELDDIKKDLEIAKRIYGNKVQRIFFLDGNAMIAPTGKLLELMEYSMKIFPNLERCGVYAHAKDILKKSDIQLKELSEAGLKIAYVGFESGYDKLLEDIHKKATKDDYIKASNKLMTANITLSATFINGLGGANKSDISEKHALESADLVNNICPEDDRIWYIAFLTLMVPSGTEIFKRLAKREFYQMDSLEILQELKLFITNIEFQNKKANCVFRSNHASNYLPIKGILDRDKQKIIDVLNYGITHTNILKPEFYRGL